MRRKELKKAVSKYAKKVKFYRYGLIAKYLKHLKKEELKLIASIPKVKCPFCGKHDIEIEYSDCEYLVESWLSCNACGESFDDEVGYIEVIEAINCIPWWDGIYNVISLDDNIDFRGLKWKQYCEYEILTTINSK